MNFSEIVKAQADSYRAAMTEGRRMAERELVPALRGLIGLTELLLARDDIPAEVRAALSGNHRVLDARAVLRRIDGGVT